MGVMNKMRENTAIVLWILVIAFGGLWVFSDSGALDVIGRDNALYVGSVNGEPIEREQFQNLLNRYQEQATQNGQTLTQSMRDQISDMVFNALVERKLMDAEMKKLGIQVTDGEVADMVFGATPDPIVLQSFGDGKGGINRTALKNFWENPERRAEVLQIQEYLREKRSNEKLAKLLESSVVVSDADLAEEYTRRNQTYQADYIALRYAEVPDKSVTINDGDIRDYYNAHKEEFKRNKTYTFNYVAIPTIASSADSARVKGELGNLREAFSKATDNAGFLQQNGSETPFDSTYKSRQAFGAGLASAIFADLTPGRVVGPISDGGDLHLIKILRSRNGKVMARARHILVGDKDAKPEDLARANAIKAEIAAGASFEQKARENSKDGSASNGGDLGWADPSSYVPEFKQAVETAPIGQVIGPIKTQFGYHLIKVEERTSQEVQLADLTRSVGIGNEGVDAIRKKLEDFVYFAGESKDFAAEAKKNKLTVQNTSVEEKSEVIPLLGRSRAIMNFLAKASTGDIHKDVVELDDKLVAVQLTQVQAEGYKSVEEVKTLLEPRVRVEKKKAVQEKKFRDALAKQGFGDGLASALGTTVSKANDVTYNNTLVQTLGREPQFAGALSALKVGQTSGVIVGENGVYMIKLTATGTANASSMTKEEKDQLRTQLKSTTAQQLRTRWMEQLKQKGDVVDNRKNFNL